MNTHFPKTTELKRDWYLIDAENQTIGEVAVEAAKLLRGKNRTDYTPHIQCGGYVVVLNCAKIRITGNKLQDKKYYKYSGHPGSLREISLGDMLQKKPEVVITEAVKGMLPGNRTRKDLMKNLHVYTGSENPHEAQQAIKVTI